MEGQRHEDERRHGSGENNDADFFVLHSKPVDRVAGRPFLMVTASISVYTVLARHLTQKISTDWDGVVIIGIPQTIWRRQLYATAAAS